MANKETEKPYSYHTFIYPFYIEDNDWNRTKTLLEKNCKRVFVDEESDKEELIVEQNSYQYFFPQAQNILFTRKKDKNRLLDHYRLEETKSGGYKYFIETDKEKLILHVTDIKLDISEQLRIGVIRLEMSYFGEKEVNGKSLIERKSDSKFNDVLLINDIGRRLFTASRDKENPEGKIIMTAKKIAIKNCKDDKDEDFSINFPTTMFSSKIEALKNLIFSKESKTEITSILDDRMFVMSAVIDKVKMKEVQTGKLDKSKLYEFYFIDSPGNCSCQNEKMLNRMMEEHSYDRWLNWGTVYGLSEYSFVMLASGEAQHVIDAFLSTYVNMAEIVLLQRAALVKLDLDASRALPDNDFKIDNIKELHKNSMFFENNLYAEEVTFQQQGIELYDMLKKFLRVKNLKGEVERKVSSLNGYINTQNEKHNREISDTISIFALLSLLTSTFNQFKKFDTIWVLIVGVIALLGIVNILFSILIPYVKERKNIDRNAKSKALVYILVTIANIIYIAIDLLSILFPKQ